MSYRRICGRCGRLETASLKITQECRGCLAERIIMCAECWDDYRAGTQPFWELMNHTFRQRACIEWDVAEMPPVVPIKPKPDRGKIDLKSLAFDCRALAKMCDEPEPGLITWRMMFYQIGERIAENFTDEE